MAISKHTKLKKVHTHFTKFPEILLSEIFFNINRKKLYSLKMDF